MGPRIVRRSTRVGCDGSLHRVVHWNCRLLLRNNQRKSWRMWKFLAPESLPKTSPMLISWRVIYISPFKYKSHPMEGTQGVRPREKNHLVKSVHRCILRVIHLPFIKRRIRKRVRVLEDHQSRWKLLLEIDDTNVLFHTSFQL
ncbi:hypothetical protein Dimus_038024 [Dionaea muscipula]